MGTVDAAREKGAAVLQTMDARERMALYYGRAAACRFAL